jgi:MYXO-CTERM domain-containing protein
LSTFAGSLTKRWLAEDEIERDVGEHDASRRRMPTNDAATYPMTQNRTNRKRGRAGLIALWVAQVALALMFLMAGGSKLAGATDMVSLFGRIGVGQWFRYVTGVIELTGGIALLIPSAAVFGAMLLIPTMIGAIVVNVFVVPASPVAPLVLLLLAAAVAWARRDQLRIS